MIKTIRGKEKRKDKKKKRKQEICVPGHRVIVLIYKL